jgi:hypothetical protein
MKITVATGAVKSSIHCHCDIFGFNMAQKRSTGSSFHPQLNASGHTCLHMYQWTSHASERTEWSSKLLEIVVLQ